MAGNATGRAVSSMKAMLDPSIVAANTQGAAFGVQAERITFERITPSSQGCLITLAIDAPGRVTGASCRREYLCYSASPSACPWLVAVPPPSAMSPAASYSHTVLPWRSRYIPQMAYLDRLQKI